MQTSLEFFITNTPKSTILPKFFTAKVFTIHAVFATQRHRFLSLVTYLKYVAIYLCIQYFSNIFVC